MRAYFEKMQEFGQELKAGQIKSTEANVGKLQEVEAQISRNHHEIKFTKVMWLRSRSGKSTIPDQENEGYDGHEAVAVRLKDLKGYWYRIF